MAKNGHVHEGGKVGRSNATPTKFVSVYSYDLKSMSFRFSNDIFITFEMLGPGSLPLNPHFIAIPSICNQRSLIYAKHATVTLVKKFGSDLSLQSKVIY